MNIYLKDVVGEERRTFKLHLAYSIIEGIIAGILVLNEFVFIKSLLGTDYQLSFLFQFSVVVFLFSIFLMEILKRIQNKKKLLRIISFSTRLPLVLLMFFPSNSEEMLGSSYYHYIFLAIFFVYFLASTIVLPTINAFLKSNYSHHNFGKLYSYATSVNKIVLLISTFFFGFLLDYDNYAFVYIYPFLGLLGIISINLLSRIKYEEIPVNLNRKKFWKTIAESINNMIDIIQKNKPYRDFEIGFMLYGFSFMVSVSVITIFFDKALNLNYSSVAFYKNAYNILAIVLLPFFGKLLGKIDPRKFAIITYSALLLYFVFMTITEYMPQHFIVFDIKIYYSLLLSFFFYGIFAATMALLWFIGSAYFCKNEDAGQYQSIHLTLTGVRAAFAPIIGIYFYNKIGFSGNFIIAIVSLVFAIGMMFWSLKKSK
ncbi:MAG: MFS transporter [Bacteroidetes bacterium]|jgi:MFS family permease|nr:MFS transporter [Bacteroidota bacterium]MBT6685103.1 MFS transporter [Bacteroidota bacterium]MBT7141932.1 MFS transporter [Bacteroidota bacterium]MBT7491183.1 MFS transporter [Bacteroidota bacterium]